MRAFSVQRSATGSYSSVRLVLGWPPRLYSLPFTPAIIGWCSGTGDGIPSFQVLVAVS